MVLEPGKSLLLNIISEECFEKYFYQYNFFDAACLYALISKGLGIGIIAGSLFVKVPQILKIWNNKSGEGINIIGVLLDLFAITSNMSYGFVSRFPFSSWGEGTFLALQTAIIAALILLYKDSILKSGLFCGFYAATCYVLMGGITSREFLWSMQVLNIPILITGKLSQAYTNYKNKSTGQLSAATCFLLFAGSLARIFTSVQETGDSMMILTYLVSSLANAIIVAQLLYYWNKTGAGGGKKQKSAKTVSQKSQKPKIKSKKIE